MKNKQLEMDTNKVDLLDEFKVLPKITSKHINFKQIILIVLFLLLFLGLIIMIILLILQSIKIKNLTNKINDLTIQFNTKSLLFSQNINNFNRTINNNIDNIKNDLRLKEEEIELLKSDSNNLNNSNSILYKDIKFLKNELIQNYKEIGICSINDDLLNNKVKTNEIKLNRNFAEIQQLQNLESNMALLVDFKIRIKADFYIGNQQAQLCSHKGVAGDTIDDSRIRLCGY